MVIRSQSLTDHERIERLPGQASGAAGPGTRERLLADEFRSSYSWLTGCVRRVVGSHSDAEDLASSAFTELAAHQDVSSVQQPRAFLTTIARRLTYEFWRRRDMERVYLETLAQAAIPVAPSPEFVLETVEEIVQIDAALQTLSKKAREAFILSQFEGLKYAEIGERLGVSASMVRKYVAQALALCCGLS
jgi:RNA polymerase sigma-70 factor (ECF subfamily)